MPPGTAGQTDSVPILETQPTRPNHTQLLLNETDSFNLPANQDEHYSGSTDHVVTYNQALVSLQKQLLVNILISTFDATTHLHDPGLAKLFSAFDQVAILTETTGLQSDLITECLKRLENLNSKTEVKAFNGSRLGYETYSPHIGIDNVAGLYHYILTHRLTQSWPQWHYSLLTSAIKEGIIISLEGVRGDVIKELLVELLQANASVPRTVIPKQHVRVRRADGSKTAGVLRLLPSQTDSHVTYSLVLEPYSYSGRDGKPHNNHTAES